MPNFLPDSAALVASEPARASAAWQWPRPGGSRRPQLPFRDLSYRFKIPFSLSLVILVTVLVVSAVVVVRSYQYLRADLIASAESLGKTLSRALTPALLRDEMWQAYETIITPFEAGGELESDRKTIVVLDASQQVYVSSHPSVFRSLTPLAEVSESHGALARIVARSASEAPFVVEDVLPNHIVVAVPVLSDDGIRLGTLLLTYAESLFLPRFWETVRQLLLSTLMVLAVLIPLGWYAGNRTVIPLVSLTRAMRRVSSEPRTSVGADLYLGGDEIGQLGRQFQAMLRELEDKQALEREMVMSDRLACIGRLTAGIAHEINNPLGGMLNAINTCRRHGDADPVTARTVSLLERGLLQIKETVAALLVEARVESHALTREDLEDVHTLVAHAAAKKQLAVRWYNWVEGTVTLPSTLVRQVLINLLLNAIQAAPPRGLVTCDVRVAPKAQDTEAALRLQVSNDGRHLQAEQLERLFEPFASEAGTGLGLWVVYQIVQQLRGEIRVSNGPPVTRFELSFPVGGEAVAAPREQVVSSPEGSR
jgi:signal transduction histidine kinase